MTHRENDRDRMADAALGEIDAPADDDDPSYALAAAAITAAHVTIDAPLPPHLAARVASDADAFFSGDTARAKSTTAAGAQVIVMAAAPNAAPLRIDYTRWGGWIAAAACVVIVVTQSIGLRATGSAAVDPSRTDRVSLHAVDRDRPMESADLAWDAHEQRGLLHTRGLAPNAPGEEYEAWLADRAGDGETLVPIGHFSVPSRAESGVTVDTVVQSPIAIAAPSRIVITVERAGGVLVSPHPHVALEGAFGPP